MWCDLKDVYRTAWAFALACPLLFLVPVVPELVQHAVEWTLGMYRSIAGAKAMEGHGARMAFGVVKVLALIVAGYWTTRFFVWRDGARARAIDPAAIARFVPVMLYEGMAAMLSLFGHGPAAAATGVSAGAVMGGVMLIELIAGLLLVHWTVTAPLGDPASGPVRSIRIMAPRIPHAFGFTIVAVLPAMAVHYALGLGAIGRPAPVAIVMLLADSLFVGYLCAVMTGTNVTIAARAARRMGQDLPPATAAGAVAA